jgi:hypothetical protein
MMVLEVNRGLCAGGVVVQGDEGRITVIKLMILRLLPRDGRWGWESNYSLRPTEWVGTLWRCCLYCWTGTAAGLRLHSFVSVNVSLSSLLPSCVSVSVPHQQILNDFRIMLSSCPSVRACVSACARAPGSFCAPNYWISWWFFVKLGIDIMPLEETSPSYLSFRTVSNTNMEAMQICKAHAELRLFMKSPKIACANSS